jgi:DNA-binding CsgD family transcriptional regulator
MRVSETGGLSAWLVIIARQPFGAATSSLLAALAPHLRTALRVFATIERERARSSMSADAFRRMNFGWIAIDSRCRIIDLDAQAERLLSQSGLLRRGPYDRLTPSSAALDRELTKRARDFALSPSGRPHALQLSRDPWIDMLVSPLPERSMVSSAQAVAVVYLRGDQSSQADRCEQLADLFALTPSEARMAWSMAQGLSIAEAAQEHGLTVETARNYSKKIYSKTGARGHADLVRHILTSVLALA